jgi:putative membrane protein
VTSIPSAEPPLPGQAGPLASADVSAATWHRLHPLTPIVRAGTRLLSLIVVLGGVTLANQGQDSSQLFIDLAILCLALSGGFISWLVTRWQVADGVLRIETGLIRRDSRRFPLTQIQAIDVVQTGIARVLGLAELQLRVAGSDSARGGRLASLRLADAERLRRDLLAISTGLAAPTGPAPQPTSPSAPASAPPGSSGPASAPPGSSGPQLPPGVSVPQPRSAPGSAPRPADIQPVPSVAGYPAAETAGAAGAADATRTLFRVRPDRLAAAIALSRAGAIALFVIAGVSAIVAVTGRTGAVAAILPAAVGIVLAVWRQFNSEFGTTVTVAPDGLRLRSGLVQTTAETIRPGRVQGVRLVEPLIWRAFGWCRLEVDVAGPKERRENRTEGRGLRALIPVGSRAEAMAMIDELLSSRPLPDRPPPRQVRLKAPLQYHFLRWGSDDSYVVAARGRVRRTTTWVPLEKVQSFRWVQGPLQRRLGLASVLLDVAGRRVSADIEDRAEAEAAGLIARLPELARSARARGR